ncbi:MAG: hypothetical protein ABFD20_11495 [Anaerolineales bacterium]
MVEQAERVLAYLRADEVWSVVLAAVRESGWPVYVVGGTVRDVLLGRPSVDLDLAIHGSALALGRSLADGLRGAFYPLDVERNVARVLVCHGGRRRQLDIAGLRAPDIEDDLRARDFTVNALAVPLHGDAPALLDPTGGLADLEAGIVRMCSASAFVDDPVRVLRLARLCGQLGFVPAPETECAARLASPALAGVAGERLRDELLSLLALPGCAAALRFAADLGLQEALCGWPIDAHQFSERLWLLETVTCWQMALWCGAGPTALQPYYPQMVATAAQEMTPGRPRWLLLRLALLVAACANGDAEGSACLSRLCLSRQEAQWVADTLASSRRLATLGEPNALSLHRYFGQARGAGASGAFVALAAALGQGRQGDALARAAQAALKAWYTEYDTIVAPPPLVTGDDLIRELGQAPGPWVGQALTAIREAQVVGTVRTRREALALAAELGTQAAGPTGAVAGGKG